MINKRIFIKRCSLIIIELSWKQDNRNKNFKNKQKIWILNDTFI